MQFYFQQFLDVSKHTFERLCHAIFENIDSGPPLIIVVISHTLCRFIGVFQNGFREPMDAISDATVSMIMKYKEYTICFENN